MKKILLIISLVFPIIASAQISVNDEMIGNIRVISAKDVSSTRYNRAERLASINNYKSVEEGESFNISPIFDIQELEFQGEKHQRKVLVFETYGTLDYSINGGSKLAIKLGNDEIIMLSSEGDCRAKNYNMVSGYQYNARPMYVITDEDLNKILNNSIVKIRMATNGSTYNFEFPNNEYSAFLKEAVSKVNSAVTKDPMTDGL